MNKVTTLGQFIIERQSDFPYAKGELSRLLRDIGIAAKIVNREVNKAGLVDILGEHGSINIQGEAVKKLDVYDQIKITLESLGMAYESKTEAYERMIYLLRSDSIAEFSERIGHNTYPKNMIDNGK